MSDWPAGWGVKDYDVFTSTAYVGGQKISHSACPDLTDDLGVTVEIKNQARVHLWYEQRFGSPYPPLGSARDGIDRYLISCTCVGIDVASGELYAPNGLEDLHDGILRINPRNRHPILFRQKAGDYRVRWPWLTIADVDLT
jgi:hypothetical protein